MTTNYSRVRMTAALFSAAAACLTISSVSAQSVILTLDDGPCEIPLQAASSVTVDPVTGNLTLDPDDGNLPTCFGSPGGVLDVDVTVNPTTIDAGNTVDVNWSVAGFVQGVTTCTATGGTSSWINDVNTSPSGGSGTYSPNSNTTFTLSCQNAGGTDAVVVTVNGGNNGGADGFPPPPAFCGEQPSGRDLPFNIFKDFLSNAPDGQPKRNYAEVWGEYPGSNEATVFVPINQYVAMPFYANQTTGKVSEITWVGGSSNGDSTTVSISRCPGDFSGVGFTDPKCMQTSGSEGSALLTIIGTGNACPLVGGANEVYYLNVRHTTATGANGCNEASQCGFLGIPRRLN